MALAFLPERWNHTSSVGTGSCLTPVSDPGACSLAVTQKVFRNCWSAVWVSFVSELFLWAFCNISWAWLRACPSRPFPWPVTTILNPLSDIMKSYWAAPSCLCHEQRLVQMARAPHPPHFLPVLISWSVLDSLYYSISSLHCRPLAAGHQKFLIQAADGSFSLLFCLCRIQRLLLKTTWVYNSIQ